MISRYALYDIAQLRDRFTLTQGLPKGIKPRYNVSPGINMPVVIAYGGERIVQSMKWGLLPKGAKDTNSIFRYKTQTIPSEKVLSKHSWETAVRNTRCVVPANGFYALAAPEKQAHYIRDKTSSLLGLAGVYSSWQDPSGEVQGTFALITIESNADVAGVAERMSVILSREDETRWLDPAVTDATTLYDMLRPFPTGLLGVHEVSIDVYSPKLEHSRLIVPL